MFLKKQNSHIVPSDHVQSKLLQSHAILRRAPCVDNRTKPVPTMHHTIGQQRCQLLRQLPELRTVAENTRSWQSSMTRLLV